MSSSSSSTSSMTIIKVKFSSIVCIDAQISIFRCLTKATNSALSSSSSSSSRGSPVTWGYPRASDRKGASSPSSSATTACFPSVRENARTKARRS